MRRTLIYVGLMIIWMLCLTVGDSDADVIVSREEIHGTVTDYVHELLSDFDGEIEVAVRQFTDLKIAGTCADRYHRLGRRRPANGSFGARASGADDT